MSYGATVRRGEPALMPPVRNGKTWSLLAFRVTSVNDPTSRPLRPADGLHGLAAEPQDGEGRDRVGVRSVVWSSARFVRRDGRERRTRRGRGHLGRSRWSRRLRRAAPARNARRMAWAARTRSRRRRPTWSGTSPQRRRPVSFRTTRGKAATNGSGAGCRTAVRRLSSPRVIRRPGSMCVRSRNC